jgi:ketosteroid isomerase-like protein
VAADRQGVRGHRGARARRFVAQDDTVAVVGHTRCVAKPTGKSYETDFVHLVTLEDGKITRFQEFFDTWAAAEVLPSLGRAAAG